MRILKFLLGFLIVGAICFCSSMLALNMSQMSGSETYDRLIRLQPEEVSRVLAYQGWMDDPLLILTLEAEDGDEISALVEAINGIVLYESDRTDYTGPTGLEYEVLLTLELTVGGEYDLLLHQAEGCGTVIYIDIANATPSRHVSFLAQAKSDMQFHAWLTANRLVRWLGC